MLQAFEFMFIPVSFTMQATAIPILLSNAYAVLFDTDRRFLELWRAIARCLVAFTLISSSVVSCSVTPTRHSAESSNSGRSSGAINISERSARQDVSSAKSSLSLENLSPHRPHSVEILDLFILPKDLVYELLSLDKKGLALVWSLSTGKSYKLEQLKGGGVQVASLTPDGKRLAYANKNEVTISDLNSAETWNLNRMVSYVTALAWSPEADALLIGTADGQVYRWRFLMQGETLKDKERQLERYVGHGAPISALAYHPYGRVFFSADWNGSLNAWLPYDADAHAGEYDQNLFGSRFFAGNVERMRTPSATRVEKLIVTGDGEFMVLALQSGALELWQVRGLKKTAEIQAHKGLIYDLAITPGQLLIATVGRDGVLKTWGVKDEIKEGQITSTISLEKKSEVKISEARRIKFFSAEKIFAGFANGNIAEVKLGA